MTLIPPPPLLRSFSAIPEDGRSPDLESTGTHPSSRPLGRLPGRVFGRKGGSQPGSMSRRRGGGEIGSVSRARADRGSGVAPRRPGHREGSRGTEVPVGAGRTAIRRGTVVPGAASGAICECGIQNSGTCWSPRTRAVPQQQGGVRIGTGQRHRRPRGGGGRFVPRQRGG